MASLHLCMPASDSTGFITLLNPATLLRTLLARREVLWQFTLRSFHTKHKGSTLGLFWALLNPLLLLSLYFTVFGLTLKIKFGVLPDEKFADTALALLLGLTVYIFLAEVISQAPTIIVSQPNLVKKVVFPLEVLPLANLGASFFNFAISLALVILGMLFFGRGLPLSALWLPVIIFPLILLGAGIGWFLAALGVFFRDITQIIQFITMLLQFASCVFYPAKNLPPQLWSLLRFNPIIHAIELLRSVMLWHQPMNYTHLAFLYASSFSVCLLGYAFFVSLRSSFADVL